MKKKTPFIEEALNEKLINVSSLARIILPEVSKALKKEVKVGAVMMAINRLSPASELRIRKNIKKLALDLGDVIVRSDLCDFAFKNKIAFDKMSQNRAINKYSFVTKIDKFTVDLLYLVNNNLLDEVYILINLTDKIPEPSLSIFTDKLTEKIQEAKSEISE